MAYHISSSGKLVAAKGIAPACFSLIMASLSSEALSFLRHQSPKVRGMPFIGWLSFAVNGTPSIKYTFIK